MIKHYVRFMSPGTFFSEETTKPIDSWDVDKARRMARDVVERHNARPYAFQFITRKSTARQVLGAKIAGTQPESTETARSGTYFIGGTVETLEQVKARNDPGDRILIRNMESGEFDRIITNCNSYKMAQPFTDQDFVI